MTPDDEEHDRERVGAVGPELLVDVVTPGGSDRDATTRRLRVLRLDRWAREDFDRRRVAIPTNVTPAPPATVVSRPDASADPHSVWVSDARVSGVRGR